MSSMSACRALSRGSDFEGSGCQSSVEEVWRTSNCSPGADADVILRTVEMFMESFELIGMLAL